MSETRPWLIVGTTTRAVAQAAARHGHKVCAIDAFADREVLAACQGRVVRLDVGEDWQITAPALDRAVRACASMHAPQGFRGIVAGSGLDGATELRADLAQFAPLAGCDRASLKALRDPVAWFSLLDSLHIPHPPVRWDAAPAGRHTWLRKSGAGSGGWHLRAWRAGMPITAGEYLQQHMAGRSGSALFAANGSTIRVLGWQWQRLSPCAALPWRYGGIVSAPDMPQTVRGQIGAALERLAARLPLRGLGSIDFLVDEDRALTLEINPRPSASIALYPEIDLFGLHVNPDPAPAPCPAWPEVRGEAVLFAQRALSLPAEAAWPADCVDLPAGAADFAPGDPVCTVQCRGASVTAVQAHLDQRLRAIAAELDSASRAPGIAPHPPISPSFKESTHDNQSTCPDTPQRQSACASPG